MAVTATHAAPSPTVSTTDPIKHKVFDQGDLLCIGSAGAYGFSMSSNYNSRGKAAEVMVDGDNMYEIRKRESIQDLIRGECILPK